MLSKHHRTVVPRRHGMTVFLWNNRNIRLVCEQELDQQPELLISISRIDQENPSKPCQKSCGWLLVLFQPNVSSPPLLAFTPLRLSLLDRPHHVSLKTSKRSSTVYDNPLLVLSVLQDLTLSSINHPPPPSQISPQDIRSTNPVKQPMRQYLKTTSR